MVDASNLTDNPFLRQYELKVGGELATLGIFSTRSKNFLNKTKHSRSFRNRNVCRRFFENSFRGYHRKRH